MKSKATMLISALLLWANGYVLTKSTGWDSIPQTIWFSLMLMAPP